MENGPGGGADSRTRRKSESGSHQDGQGTHQPPDREAVPAGSESGSSGEDFQDLPISSIYSFIELPSGRTGSTHKTSSCSGSCRQGQHQSDGVSNERRIKRRRLSFLILIHFVKCLYSVNLEISCNLFLSCNCVYDLLIFPARSMSEMFRQVFFVLVFVLQVLQPLEGISYFVIFNPPFFLFPSSPV